MLHLTGAHRRARPALGRLRRQRAQRAARAAHDAVERRARPRRAPARRAAARASPRPPRPSATRGRSCRRATRCCAAVGARPAYPGAGGGVLRAQRRPAVARDQRDPRRRAPHRRARRRARERLAAPGARPARAGGVRDARAPAARGAAARRRAGALGRAGRAVALPAGQPRGGACRRRRSSGRSARRPRSCAPAARSRWWPSSPRATSRPWSAASAWRTTPTTRPTSRSGSSPWKHRAPPAPAPAHTPPLDAAVTPRGAARRNADDASTPQARDGAGSVTKRCPRTWRISVSPQRSTGQRRVGVAVQQHRRVLALDVLAQAREADVGGVVGVVVDAQRRAVGQQHVDVAELAQELAGLLLTPRVARLAPVLVAAGEAAEPQPGDLDAPQVDALDAQARRTRRRRRGCRGRRAWAAARCRAARGPRA